MKQLGTEVLPCDVRPECNQECEPQRPADLRNDDPDVKAELDEAFHIHLPSSRGIGLDNLFKLIDSKLAPINGGGPFAFSCQTGASRPQKLLKGLKATQYFFRYSP